MDKFTHTDTSPSGYERSKRFLLIFVLVLLALYLSFRGLALAKGILAPLFLASIISMMLVPVCNFLENKGFGRGWAVFVADLLFVCLILGILWAVVAEIQQILGEWSSVQDRLSRTLADARSFIEKNTGISLAGGQGAESTQATGSIFQKLPLRDWLTSFLQNVFSSLTTLLLVVIYIFFMLLLRDKFKKGVLKFVPEQQQEKGKKVL